MPTSFRSVTRCRICASGELWGLLDLGPMPLANAFVTDPAAREQTFPLAVIRCADCGLVQLSVVVRPEILFADYPYWSSASSPLREHFNAYAEDVVPRFAPAGSLVVEIGSNDGVMLRPLKERGVRVLGIEPASNLAEAANRSGLATWNEFFGEPVARRVVDTLGPASAVIANNVLAHIDDLEAVTRALGILLDEKGVFVAEVPYLVDLLDAVEYDTIYHEHLSYFAVRPLVQLFARAGLELFGVRRVPIHGGTIRIHVARKGAHAIEPSVADLERLERDRGLDSDVTYVTFAERVRRSRDALREIVLSLKREGRRIAGYGAAAKGNTLLNYCGLGSAELDFVADTTPQKQGRFTPGTHIPVLPDAALMERKPDYAVLLAWNHASAILRRHADYLAAGGHFIHPIPLARVI